MVIFLMFDALAIVLHIMAWLIIVVHVSKMSLYEALCNTPGDCPVVFNQHYAVGLAISVGGVVVVLPQ